jgi:hypothetical protein
MDDETATRIYLDGGQYVRASETIGEVAGLIGAESEMDGFVPVQDPGDGRSKLIRADRVLWIEQEAGI